MLRTLFFLNTRKIESCGAGVSAFGGSRSNFLYSKKARSISLLASLPCSLKTAHARSHFHLHLFFRSSPRPISNSQLHALLHFHLCPIYLILSKGSYFFRMGYLILRGASRLDAFSVYPCPTWLPGYAPGGTAGAPAVGPSRSSRTKDSSSQISCAHAG